MKKLILFSIIAFTFYSTAYAQNITNKLGSNGFFVVTDATGVPVYLTIKNSSGDVGIGSNSFDATNPEQLLVDCGVTNSVNAIYAKGTINSYFQFNIRNFSTGSQASSDVVATSNNGTETTNFIDFGINNSGYQYQNGNAIETGKSNDTYILAAGNDFYLVNNNATKDILFLAGGTANSNERMRIKYNGKVGIGTTTINYLLSLGGGAYSNGTTWSAASDSTLKRDVRNMDKYGLADLMKMRAVTYYYKADSTNKQEIGFIAQELKLVIPEVVSGEEGNMGISYGNLVPVLVNAIKEQQQEIDGQKKEIESIKADIRNIKSSNKTETAGMNFGGANAIYLLLISLITGSLAIVLIKRKK
jgi:hypothetical protein